MMTKSREAAAAMEPTRPLTVGTTALAGAALAACGGGGGGAETLIKGPAPVRPAAPVVLSVEDEAARFLNQAGLGATKDDVDLVVEFGADRWLDAQFELPLKLSQDPKNLTLFDLAKSFDFYKPGQPNAGAAPGANQGGNLGTDRGIDNALWYRLFTAPDVLRQRVVLALSQIFVVSARNMAIPWGQFACIAYWDLLEAHCFGSFRDLVGHITRSPAMGTYLSMRGSQKADTDTGRQPDENFARELLQLFTIGLAKLDINGDPLPEETYSITDITELAKVFTGWDFDTTKNADEAEYTRHPMVFNPQHHSPGPKIVLGQALTAKEDDGEAALNQALDIICDHPNVGIFIAKQLIQRLVSSNPEPGHVARVAAIFNKNGVGVRGDLRAVIHAVLLDPVARGELGDVSSAKKCKLSEPILRFVHWGRLAKVTSTRSNLSSDTHLDYLNFWNAGNLSASDTLNQSPLRSPSVFNFFRPGYVPLNSGLSADRAVAPEFQITDESSVIGYCNFMYDTLPNGTGGIVPNYESWDALAKDPKALVDRLNWLMTGRTLLPNTVDIMVLAVQDASAEPALGRSLLRNRVLAAFYLMLCSPEALVQR